MAVSHRIGYGVRLHCGRQQGFSFSARGQERQAGMAAAATGDIDEQIEKLYAIQICSSALQVRQFSPTVAAHLPCRTRGAAVSSSRGGRAQHWAVTRFLFLTHFYFNGESE